MSGALDFISSYGYGYGTTKYRPIIVSSSSSRMGRIIEVNRTKDLLSLLSLLRGNVGDVHHFPLRRNQFEDITTRVENAEQFTIGRQMGNNAQL